MFFGKLGRGFIYFFRSSETETCGLHRERTITRGITALPFTFLAFVGTKMVYILRRFMERLFSRVSLEEGI